MFLFGKERHGTVEYLDGAKRRRFVWTLPNFNMMKQGTYDSPKVDSFQGTSFHFHMMIGAKWDIGFYMHYKSVPIPKYSFYFAAAGIVPGEAGPRMLRQHTAHSIPPETERCGHWNVCSMTDALALLDANSSTSLKIFVTLDDDSVLLENGNDVSAVVKTHLPASGATPAPMDLVRSASPEKTGYAGPWFMHPVFHPCPVTATRVIWLIRSPRSVRFCPLTSRNYLVETNPIVIRIDRLGEDNVLEPAPNTLTRDSGETGSDAPYNCFIFTRTNGIVPRHRIAVFDGTGAVLADDDESVFTADQPGHVLRIPAAKLDAARRQDKDIIVAIMFQQGNNPLEFFNLQRLVASAPPSTPAMASIGGKEGGAQYHVMGDEL